MDLADPVDAPRYIQVGVVHYPEGLLDAAVNTILLERVAAVVRSAPTERGVMRGLRSLKDKSQVPHVLREALRRVMGEPGIDERAVRAKGGVVVARFPVPPGAPT